MNDPQLKQSVLADMVTLAPKARTLLESLTLPESDETWQQYRHAFRRCLAWVEYWKAEGDCPELGLIDANLRTQIAATIMDADRLQSPKLAFKFPEQATALEKLSQYGLVYSKGWVVMQWEVGI